MNWTRPSVMPQAMKPSLGATPKLRIGDGNLIEWTWKRGVNFDLGPTLFKTHILRVYRLSSWHSNSQGSYSHCPLKMDTKKSRIIDKWPPKCVKKWTTHQMILAIMSTKLVEM